MNVCGGKKDSSYSTRQPRIMRGNSNFRRYFFRQVVTSILLVGANKFPFHFFFGCFNQFPFVPLLGEEKL